MEHSHRFLPVSVPDRSWPWWIWHSHWSRRSSPRLPSWQTPAGRRSTQSGTYCGGELHDPTVWSIDNINWMIKIIHVDIQVLSAVYQNRWMRGIQPVVQHWESGLQLFLKISIWIDFLKLKLHYKDFNLEEKNNLIKFRSKWEKKFIVNWQVYN